jgi:N-acetylglutamate synthase/N-acetylornithine aminotransferase
MGSLQVTIGSGPGRGMAWGCDLSYDYVKVKTAGFGGSL